MLHWLWLLVAASIGYVICGLLTINKTDELHDRVRYWRNKYFELKEGMDIAIQRIPDEIIGEEVHER